MKKSIWFGLMAVGLVGAGVMHPACADTSVVLGAWRADFDAASSRLTLRHAESGTRISGTLSFVGPAQVTGAGVAADAEKTAVWKVADSHDGARNRLALVDPADNVNGYITFQSDGDSVSMLVYHRTAFAYAGTLTFDAEVDYRADAFACRLTPKKGDRVLSVKSGGAVSADDDALFSPAADEALHVGGCALNGRRLSAAMEITDPTSSQISFRIVKGYYRSRWVPYYRPLDRTRAPHAPCPAPGRDPRPISSQQNSRTRPRPAPAPPTPTTSS